MVEVCTCTHPRIHPHAWLQVPQKGEEKLEPEQPKAAPAGGPKVAPAPAAAAPKAKAAPAPPAAAPKEAPAAPGNWLATQLVLSVCSHFLVNLCK